MQVIPSEAKSITITATMRVSLQNYQLAHMPSEIYYKNAKKLCVPKDQVMK